MRKHKLLCTTLALSLALTFQAGLTPVPASASGSEQAAISSGISAIQDNADISAAQNSGGQNDNVPSDDHTALSQDEMTPEDPEAYCQGNATEINEQQTQGAQADAATENSLPDDPLSSVPGRPSLKQSSTSVSPFTGAIYTHADAFDGMNIYHGVDVSYHQGDIDWDKVKAAGVDFAIIRMGYRGYSIGTLYTDTRFTEYMRDAINAGLKVGVYFFTEATTVDEAIVEAQYVANAIAPYDITMPVAIDWETNAAAPDGGRKIVANLTKEQNTKICTAFCDIISSYGYTPMVYANKSDFTTRLDGAALSEKYEIWLARYNTVADYANAYSFWQYSAGSATNKGTVSGITGNVDLNFWYTTSTIDSPVFAHSTTGAAISTPTSEPTKVDDLKNLSSTSATKNITLSWSKVANATGYEIYRKDTYNGSYQLVKTITNGETTSWKNTSLSKKHEYYYKVRAYITISTGKIYSSYSLITAATKPSSQVGITKKSLTLTKKPAKKATALVTVAAGASLEYVGRTYLNNGNTFLHVRCYTSTKTYDGYLPTSASLKYYSQGTTTAHLNLRKTASLSGKLLTSIPKNTPVAIMGKKKVSGATWYKTSYTIKKGKIYNGYVSGSYITK